MLNDTGHDIHLLVKGISEHAISFEIRSQHNTVVLGLPWTVMFPYHINPFVMPLIPGSAYFTA